MTDAKFVSSQKCFKGKDYWLSVSLEDASNFTIELADLNSDEAWRSTFQAEYIEELTNKTGNFKKFSVFLSMLNTAIKEKSCTSLHLDLMSYSDLEQLRRKKLSQSAVASSRDEDSGSSHANNNSAHSQPDSHTNTHNQLRKYLILTYQTEFDKIHYPLPLNFAGRQNCNQLRTMIAELRQELCQLKNRPNDYEQFEIASLNKKILELQTENARLTAAHSSLQVEHTQRMAALQDSASVQREAAQLRTALSHLDANYASERAKLQRVSMRKIREINALNEQLAEARANERSLRNRLHTLTNELAIYKRDRPLKLPPSYRPPRSASPSPSGAGSRRTPLPHQLTPRSAPFLLPPLSSNRRPRSAGPAATSIPRGRGGTPGIPRAASPASSMLSSTAGSAIINSGGRRSSLGGRASASPPPLPPQSPNHRALRMGMQRSFSAERASSLVSHTSSRSATQRAVDTGKFDPTAYVRERKRRLNEISQKRKQMIEARLNTSAGGSQASIHSNQSFLSRNQTNSLHHDTRRQPYTSTRHRMMFSDEEEEIVDAEQLSEVSYDSRRNDQVNDDYHEDDFMSRGRTRHRNAKMGPSILNKNPEAIGRTGASKVQRTRQTELPRGTGFQPRDNDTISRQKMERRRQLKKILDSDYDDDAEQIPMTSRKLSPRENDVEKWIDKNNSTNNNEWNDNAFDNQNREVELEGEMENEDERRVVEEDVESASHEFNSSKTQVADIDRRIDVLQDFLKMYLKV